MKTELILDFKRMLRPIFYRFRHIYWETFGRPYELLNHKRKKIIEMGHRYNCSTFIETGSYLGDTIEVCRHHFKSVLSVELSELFYEFCRWRFKKCFNVHLFCGDSSITLPYILDTIENRALFLLDGHYSGGSTAYGETACPLISELDAIKKHERKDHIILIDDSRFFGTTPGYPAMEEVRKSLLLINPKYNIYLADDIIHAVL